MTAPFTAGDLLQAIPVVMGLVAAVPFSLLPSRRKRRPLHLAWLLGSLALFVAAFGLAAADAWWSFWVALAGMASSLLLLGVLLLATVRETRTRRGTRPTGPRSIS